MSEQTAERPPLHQVKESAASPLSILGHLKERREQIVKSTTTTISVPRWTNPAIKVEFEPVDHGLIRKGQFAAEKLKGARRAQAEVEANMDVLIAGCVRVFAEIDGKEYSLRTGDHEGEPTKFDHDLAENLGCGVTAREVVRALYIYDGDIISTASAVGEFSGYKEQDADEQLQGE